MMNTYRGTRIEKEWMPLALANGLEDGRDRHAPKDGLYRVGILNKMLYAVGRFFGKLNRKETAC